MTKKESEPKVRALCHEWAAEVGLPLPPSNEHYSFSSFTAWIEKKGYGELLKFRSTGGPLYAAEIWFNHEFKQTWRD